MFEVINKFERRGEQITAGSNPAKSSRDGKLILLA